MAHSPQQPQPFIILKGTPRGASRSNGWLWLQRKGLYNFTAWRLYLTAIFKSKEDFRPCLLQTGAKVSLDLKTCVKHYRGGWGGVLAFRSCRKNRHTVRICASCRLAEQLFGRLGVASGGSVTWRKAGGVSRDG